MAKEKERQLAHFYYVEKQQTAKEVAPQVGVSEKTMTAWVNKFGWKAEREARVCSSESRAENIKQLISEMANERISLNTRLQEALNSGKNKQATEIRQHIGRLDSGVANWNKTLEQIDKKNKIPLHAYLNVMEEVFKALRLHDSKLYMETLPFQEVHVYDISQKLG